MSLADLRTRYEVAFIDADRHVVGMTKRWTALDLVPRFNDLGTWSIDLPANDRVLEKLVRGGGVVIKRNGEYVIGGPYRNLNKRRDRTTTGGTVTLDGAAFELHLGVLAWADPTVEIDLQDGQQYDTQTGPTESVLYQYADRNVGPSALARRQVPGLYMGSDLARGATVTGNADFDVLPELLTKLALTDGYGYRIVPDGFDLRFEVFVPEDKAGAVRFRWDDGNIASQEYTLSGPQATEEIVAGQGVGVWRLFRSSRNDTDRDEWGVRLEKFVDRRDTNDDDLLDQAGAEALAMDAAGVSVTLTVQDTHGLQYQRDWSVGNRVTYNVDGIEYADLVREARIQVGARGESISPTVGPAGSSQTPWPYRGLAQVIRALHTQQRRR